MYTTFLSGEQSLIIAEDTVDNVDVAKFVRGDVLRLTILVGSGVTVNSSDATLGGAIYCSVPIDPAKSRVVVRNAGTILGCNGEGGRGAYDLGNPGLPGKRGCDGVQFNCPIVVYNELGQINAGGGGGGGGGAEWDFISAGGGGGGGFPGGARGYVGDVQPPTEGETAQYGPAAGGQRSEGSQGNGGKGGDCNGAGLAGDNGDPGGDAGGGAGGAAGIGVNSLGNGVDIKSGATNIIGGTA